MQVGDGMALYWLIFYLTCYTAGKKKNLYFLATSVYYSRGFGGWASARSRTTRSWGAPWRALGPSPCAAIPLTLLWTVAVAAHVAMLAFCIRSLMNLGYVFSQFILYSSVCRDNLVSGHSILGYWLGHCVVAGESWRRAVFFFLSFFFLQYFFLIFSIKILSYTLYLKSIFF